MKLEAGNEISEVFIISLSSKRGGGIILYKSSSKRKWIKLERLVLYLTFVGITAFLKAEREDAVISSEDTLRKE